MDDKEAQSMMWGEVAEGDMFRHLVNDGISNGGSREGKEGVKSGMRRVGQKGDYDTGNEKEDMEAAEGEAARIVDGYSNEYMVLTGLWKTYNSEGGMFLRGVMNPWISYVIVPNEGRWFTQRWGKKGPDYMLMMVRKRFRKGWARGKKGFFKFGKKDRDAKDPTLWGKQMQEEKREDVEKMMKIGKALADDERKVYVREALRQKKDIRNCMI